jgi:putative ABC transport system permease protein
VILGENAARKLGLRAGDVLELVTKRGLQRFEVYAVVVDYTSDQGACLIDRRWYLEYWQDDMVDTVDVFLEKGADLGTARDAIKRALGGGDTLFVVSAAEVRDEIGSVITQALQVFSSTDLLALMVAILGVIGTMFAAVIDRIREIGVMRAIGATRRQVELQVMLEAGFLGLAAALAGILAAVPMGIVFVRVLGLVGTGWHVDYIFPAAKATRIALLVVAAALLAGVLPGRRTSKMAVTEALAYE